MFSQVLYPSRILIIIQTFDQSFAEQLANILYKQADLRVDICKALQNLISSNRSVLAQDVPNGGGITAEQAQKNLDHLAGFAGNILAVLFNIYTETLPQYRGYILTCIDAFFSITPAQVRVFIDVEVISNVQAGDDDHLGQSRLSTQFLAS